MICIFLTGERQIGKSTAISLFLERFRKQERTAGRDDPVIGGFRTVFGPGASGRTLYMVRLDPDCRCPDSLNDPYDPDFFLSGSEKKIVAELHDDKMTGKPEAFDSFSQSVFRDPEKCSLILMDELGFLEKDAAIFRKNVFDILDGNVPVIGVIRQGFPGWTKEITGRRNVRILTVTPENRDSIPETIMKIFSEKPDGNKLPEEKEAGDVKLFKEDQEEMIPVSAVIMASGRSVRFKGKKLLEPIDGIPMIEILFRKIPDGLFSRVSVVSGDEKILTLARSCGFDPVMNDDPGNDTAVTIRKGLENTPENSAGCMFLVGDQPLLKTESIRALCDNFRKDPEKIHALGFSGKRGNPVIFPGKLFPVLRKLAPGESGKDLIRRSDVPVILSEAQDGSELTDIDYREDLEKIHEEQNMRSRNGHLMIRLSGFKDFSEDLFCRGMNPLFQNVVFCDQFVGFRRQLAAAAVFSADRSCDQRKTESFFGAFDHFKSFSVGKIHFACRTV
ncbi:NTP transferase domain-containing protein [Methanosarcinaceae archaeon]|nr:NTP transferase domain-containing protein [Methanosarcinaceae archaeon]